MFSGMGHSRRADGAPAAQHTSQNPHPHLCRSSQPRLRVRVRGIVDAWPTDDGQLRRGFVACRKRLVGTRPGAVHRGDEPGDGCSTMTCCGRGTPTRAPASHPWPLPVPPLHRPRRRPSLRRAHAPDAQRRPGIQRDVAPSVACINLNAATSSGAQPRLVCGDDEVSRARRWHFLFQAPLKAAGGAFDEIGHVAANSPAPCNTGAEATGPARLVRRAALRRCLGP